MGGRSTALVTWFIRLTVRARVFVVSGYAGLRPGERDRIVAGGANVPALQRAARLAANRRRSSRDQHPLYEHMIDDMDINAGVILGERRLRPRRADF